MESGDGEGEEEGGREERPRGLVFEEPSFGVL
jgi:hypothetical protein